MSRLGEKIAGSIPDSAIAFVHEHPRAVYAFTVPVLAYAVYTLLQAMDLQVRAEMFVAERLGEM